MMHDCQFSHIVVVVEGEEVAAANMTAVQQPPMTGDAGLRWDANMVDSDLEEFEDDETNSAKLFERSRIRALAGMLLCGCDDLLNIYIHSMFTHTDYLHAFV